MPRTIAIFTDGTGNSAKSIFKTNVWKVYQALDLSEEGPFHGWDRQKQIAYYQDGIGTSDIKLLATLGGAFGWGLKRNVVDAYVRLCEIYEPDDRIFLFGFSRGGFTARVLLGLILNQGLLRHRTTAELIRYGRDAYRAYRHSFDQTGWIVTAFRYVRDVSITGWRLALGHPRYDPKRMGNIRYEPEGMKDAPGLVRFIGVWDTVSAYGLPIAELTRGIDRWIWPLTFPDNRLPKGVDIARQALALDDEREAFHPLPWDEMSTEDPERILQVWFAGMHADVGGGYPQEGLSLIPLAWMMREAESAGLRFKDGAIAEVERWLSHSAPMHDSRRLFGAYYRYQPRRLDALINPPSPDTRIMTNPFLSGRGLLCNIKIHESVMRRIGSVAERYAPIVLNKEILVVPQSRTEPISDPQPHSIGFAELEEIWSLVWLKRFVYFITVGVTITLFAFPLIADANSACEEVQCLLIPVSFGVSNLLPGLLRSWAQGIGAKPAIFIWLLVALFGLVFWSRHLKRALQDQMHTIWSNALPASFKEESRMAEASYSPVRERLPILQGISFLIPDLGWLLRFIRWLAQSSPYQAFFQVFRWQFLPNAFGVAILALGLLSVTTVALSMASRFDIVRHEKAGSFCKQTVATNPISQLKKLPDEFFTSAVCWPTGLEVKKGVRYRIIMDVTEPWSKGSDVYANPLGVDSSNTGWFKSVEMIFLRRSMRGRWFQPLIRISRSERSEVQVLNMSFITGHTFAGSFTAGQDGELSLFVNEIMISSKGVTTDYYKDNQGRAVVTVEPLSEKYW